MYRNQKFELNQETQRKHWLLRFGLGCKALVTDIRKAVVVIAYGIAFFFIWQYRSDIFRLPSTIKVFSSLYYGLWALLLPFLFVIGLFLLVVLLGTPSRGRSIGNNLRRIGLVNHAGEAPLLVTQQKQYGSRITILEFETHGTPLPVWENKRQDIEAALNVHVAKIEAGATKRRILLHTVPASAGLPNILHWKNSYLSKENFVLVLGESLLGKETVDLARIPHLLLGGSTGSGKSLLLKLLLMQCVKKGAKVYIADFKGGVDFPEIWHRKCRMCFEENDLLTLLTGLINELERRKRIFKETGCANIDEYNRVAGKTSLRRIVFACDEIAEVLDRTGASKDEKEFVSKIISKMSMIARQGRAFGICQILSTQRPDANILPGQVKNNIGGRFCGRCDQTLSMIILDNADANDLIPKDAQGRFLRNDGTVFQAYWLDETRAFDSD